MRNTHNRLGALLAALVAGTAVVCAQVPGAEVAYDNTTSPLGLYYGNANLYEFGDEITLEGFGDNTFVNLVFMEVAYTVPADFVPQPGVKVGQLHIYDLTGPVDPDPIPHPTPGAELRTFDFDIENMDSGAIVEIWDSVIVPRRFVWTVSIGGMTVADGFGLDLYDPPLVGDSGNDFWIKEPTGWRVMQIDNGNIPANFYARVLAIPEPSPLLLLVAGAACLWLARRRS